MRVARLLSCLFTLAVFAARADAQDTAKVADQTDAVRVYLDCDERGCERDYFIEQVGFVNWVRDRANADVHLLISTIETGSGGREYTLAFLGANRFAGVRDSLKFNSVPNESQEATRSGLVKVVKLGLVRFAAFTSVGRRIEVSYETPKKTDKAAIRDPWNFWTFEVSGEAFGNGEKSYGSLYLYQSVEANRITEKWKTELELSNNYQESRFELDSTTFHNYQRSSGASLLLGRSVSSHWTFGGYAHVGRSDYQNQRLSAIVAPALEYDLFPYAQATRRQLTALYVIGPRLFKYRDTTLYDRIEETLLFQQLIVSLRTKQTWGSSNVSFSANSYPTKPDFYRLQMNGNVELQVVKGLSLRLGGYAARVNDQLYLQKDDLTDEETLVRQRSLATNYEYFVSAGFSYTFGSIYNTIVNPRFRNLGDF